MMTAITNFVDQGFDAILGQNPEITWGRALPDGDAYGWKEKRVGSKYVYVDTTNNVSRWYIKRKNDQRDDDWQIEGGLHCVTDTFTRAQMTDGGGATGTFVLGEKIPAGAWVMQTILENVTGFTGNVSATIQTGDGSDVDRYTTGTPSVFTTASAIDPGVPSGTKIHTAEATVTVTITASADFTAIAAGQATIKIYYLK